MMHNIFTPLRWITSRSKSACQSLTRRFANPSRKRESLPSGVVMSSLSAVGPHKFNVPGSAEQRITYTRQSSSFCHSTDTTRLARRTNCHGGGFDYYGGTPITCFRNAWQPPITYFVLFGPTTMAVRLLRVHKSLKPQRCSLSTTPFTTTSALASSEYRFLTLSVFFS